MKIPPEIIDEIRRRTDFPALVRRHVEIKRNGAGGWWSGLCPFHNEKTPSFRVNENGYFNCFGCGAKGDLFHFVQRVESLTFVEAVRELAQAAGVDLPDRDQTPAERRASEREASERERMRRAMSLAVELYQAELMGPAGAAARAYLQRRGVSHATAQAFRIGYAPPGGTVLHELLAHKQVPLGDAERLGLVRRNERGVYDFFRDRIMLPVFDRQKRPVGFSGRLLDPEAKAAKYVNTQDSPLFHKKELLYGLHLAQEAIRRTGRAVVVEGNFDVIALHEAGIAEAVAPMGTALTGEQVGLLGRLGRQVIVLFDGDEAGLRASRRVIPLFVEAEVDGRIARLPRGMDPDDLVRGQGEPGLRALRDLLNSARPVVERFIDDVVAETEPTVPGRLAALEQVTALLAQVKNPTARELYGARLATALGLEPAQVARALRAALARARANPPRGGEGERAPTPGSPAPTGGSAPERPGPAAESPPPHPLEVTALALLVGNPELSGSPEVRRVGELLVHPDMRRGFRRALEPLVAGVTLDVPAWIEELPESTRKVLWRLLSEGGFSRMPGADRAVRDMVRKLEVMRIDGELAMVDRHLKDSQERRDDAAVATLNQRKLHLIAQKKQIAQPHA